jgi:hypothetical protein
MTSDSSLVADFTSLLGLGLRAACDRIAGPRELLKHHPHDCRAMLQLNVELRIRRESIGVSESLAALSGARAGAHCGANVIREDGVSVDTAVNPE